jgi:hypothetical protein
MPSQQAPPPEPNPLEKVAVQSAPTAPPGLGQPLDVGDLTDKTRETALKRRKMPKYAPDEARFIAAVVTAMGDSIGKADLEKAVGILKSKGEPPDVTVEVARSYSAAREEYLDAKNKEKEGVTEHIAHDPYNRAVRQLKDALKPDPEAYGRYFPSIDGSALAGKHVIPMFIDDYDDIFSPYDHRDYSKRDVSLETLQRIKDSLASDGGKPVALFFEIAGEHWNRDTEEIIKNRLKKHFRDEEKRIVEGELKKIRKRGLLGMAAGVALFAAYKAVDKYGPSGYGPELVATIVDWAGFVMGFWGADQLLIDARPLKREAAFNRRMSDSEIFFENY